MNANDLPITPKTEPPAAAAPPVSCGVVQDLMPLVRDGVASAESEALVQAHIESCADCRALWDALPATSAAPAQPDDAAVLKTVRTHVRLWLLVVVVVGLALGMAVLNSGRATGLIFVIFPLTCGIACWFDDVIWKLIPILAGGSAAIAFLPGFVSTWQASTFLEALSAYLTGASMPVLVLAVLCLLGALAARLLRYAVKGKGRNER